MIFDCIIIGGGISGLTCGIKCVSEGLSCAIISSGMSALHFSSGSIDLLGYYPGREVIYSPFNALDYFITANPDHPYSKVGPDIIEESFDFFKKHTAENNLEFHSNASDNHFHVTPFGTLKPTFLSQKSVFNEQIKYVFSGNPKIAIITFEGFRDFNPDMVAANLVKNRLFRNCEIITGSIRLPDADASMKSPHELRSIDIARIFDTLNCIETIASQINRIAQDSEFVGMPAFTGIKRYNEILENLCNMTGKIIYEIPSLPPSILGMRLDNALKSGFAEHGGIFMAGDRVIGGKISDGKVDHIFTENHKHAKLSARFFILSTGSFFSNGIAGEYDIIREPVFDLPVDYSNGRKTWHASAFFSRESHPFLSFGVRTDRKLNPFDPEGNPVENLFCIGAVISGYDPVMEGSGGGVAISTGYYAAKHVIQGCKGKSARID